MDKELRGLLFEIIFIFIVIVFIIPICVNASHDYNEKKNNVVIAEKSYVNIKNNGEYKIVKVTTDSVKSVKVNLYMKISKFDNDYLIYLDDSVFDIDSLEYTEDEEFRFYNLGIYDIENVRNFKFKIEVKDRAYYTEAITYSFYTEGMI